MIESFARTDVGCVRGENQDRIFADHRLGAFIVADGMGGQKHGEIAAELAVSSLRYYLESSQDRFDVTWPFGYDYNLSVDANRLTTGIQLANQHVFRYAQKGPEYSGMGTTVAALLISGFQIISANVGDSRVYRFRRNELTQLSQDDTFVNYIAQRGGLTADEIRNHPMRNVLTQAAGSQDALEVHIREDSAESGDHYLICSDGLHSVIQENEIAAILTSRKSLEETVDRLIEAAKTAGGPDNVSSILVRFE